MIGVFSNFPCLRFSTIFVNLWLKFSGEAALKSFIAARELSITIGWPNRDTEWMSPYLVLNYTLDSNIINIHIACFFNVIHISRFNRRY